MSSMQHNESLEGVLGEKRPGRGGQAPVSGAVAGLPQTSPDILRKGYIWRPQVSSPRCNILHPGIWGLLSQNSLLNSSVSLLNLPLKKKAHACDWRFCLNAGCWCAWLISAAQEFCLFTSASLVRHTLNT